MIILHYILVKNKKSSLGPLSFLKWTFLITLLLKRTIRNPLLAPISWSGNFLLHSYEKDDEPILPQVAIPYYISGNKHKKSSLGPPSFLKCQFLITLLLTNDEIPYYILIKKKGEILPWSSSLLKWPFLITLLFKNDE